MQRWSGPESAPRTLVFACGDDGRVDDPVPARVSAVAEAHGMRVCRVAMDERLGDATADAWLRVALDAAAKQATGRLMLGGSSRGARIAAREVEPLRAERLLVFSYPFHHRNDPEPGDRVGKLCQGVRTLLVQGSRDATGNREQVIGYELPRNIDVHWVEDGNHALVPRPSSGIDPQMEWDRAEAAIASFIQRF